MQVILVEKVRNLGNIGDLVNVKSGYGRNFLVPQKKAMVATKANIAVVGKKRAELEKVGAEHLAVAKSRAESLANITITVYAKVGEENHLYGSVNVAEVSEAITQAGVEVNKGEVVLPEGPIRELGEFEVVVQLHSDVNQKVKLIVAAEE